MLPGPTLPWCALPVGLSTGVSLVAISAIRQFVDGGTAVTAPCREDHAVWGRFLAVLELCWAFAGRVTSW